MAKPIELVYDVREALKEYSDDSELDNRYIMYLFNIKRSKYIRQQLEKFGRSFSNSDLQTLCVGLETVSVNECGLDFECDTILRTKKPLPKLLELNTKNALYRVGPTNRMSKKFTLVNRDRATHYKHSIFKNGIKTFLHDDNHLYFISDDEIFTDCVSVTGIFDNPLDLANYKNCCDCPDAPACFDEYETEYPLQPHLLDYIRTDVIRELIGRERLPEDKINNSQNDI